MNQTNTKLLAITVITLPFVVIGCATSGPKLSFFIPEGTTMGDISIEVRNAVAINSEGYVAWSVTSRAAESEVPITNRDVEAPFAYRLFYDKFSGFYNDKPSTVQLVHAGEASETIIWALDLNYQFKKDPATEFWWLEIVFENLTDEERTIFVAGDTSSGLDISLDTREVAGTIALAGFSLPQRSSPEIRRIESENPIGVLLDPGKKTCIWTRFVVPVDVMEADLRIGAADPIHVTVLPTPES